MPRLLRSGCLALALALAGGLATAPAHGGSFQPPEGCEVWLTLQSKGCSVSQYYKCQGDAPGDQWRADFDQEGLFFQSRIDRETQWVESHDIFPPSVQRLDPNPEDPASFSELLADGRDDFVFELSKDTGEHTRVRGFDQTLGQTVTIDGVDLTLTQFEFEETDDQGNVLRRARGQEYIHPEWRLFFSGASEYWDGQEWLPFEASPMQFIFPGEPGFGATQPIYDCDAVMSLLWTKDQPHDHL